MSLSVFVIVFGFQMISKTKKIPLKFVAVSAAIINEPCCDENKHIRVCVCLSLSLSLTLSLSFSLSLSLSITLLSHEQ